MHACDFWYQVNVLKSSITGQKHPVCMSVCACECVCMYVCMCIWILYNALSSIFKLAVCVEYNFIITIIIVCMCLRICVCVCMRTSACVYVCIHICTCKHMFVCVCVYVMYVCLLSVPGVWTFPNTCWVSDKGWILQQYKTGSLTWWWFWRRNLEDLHQSDLVYSSAISSGKPSRNDQFSAVKNQI